MIFSAIRKLASAVLVTATLCILSFPAVAAAQANSYGVLPFVINGPDKYAYLGNGIQDMLTSRLYWKDQLEPAAKEDLRSAGSAAVRSTAASVRENLGLDYLVWGSLTVMGEDCSLDVEVLGPEGGVWPKSVASKITTLIPTLETVAGEINSELFKRPSTVPQVATETAKKTAVMNPGLVYNESSQSQQFYLNPEFRYAGDQSSGSRSRTQRLPFSAHGLFVADADNDGALETFFIDKHHVYAYRYRDRALDPLDEYEISHNITILNLNVLDTNKDGKSEIIVSAIDKEDVPQSFVLHFQNGKFSVDKERLKMFFNVVRTPPLYMPTLIGQKPGFDGLIDGTVHEIISSGGEWTLGKRILLPGKANCFNIAYLPQKDDYKLLVVDDTDKIRVFAPSGERLYKSDDMYAASSVGLEYDESLPGLTNQYGYETLYFIPMRMLTTDLDQDGDYEVIVSKPISTAAQFFQRYRFYPQGEVHSLFWDGVGLNLRWKTRRIKGAVMDVAIKDIDGDGTTDMCVLVNTHPGLTGTGERRTLMLIYPLAIGEVQPGATPVHRDFLPQ